MPAHDCVHCTGCGAEDLRGDEGHCIPADGHYRLVSSEGEESGVCLDARVTCLFPLASYDHQFDLAHLERYKQDLFQFMDDSLSQELDRVSTTMLGRIHQDTQKNLIGQSLTSGNFLLGTLALYECVCGSTDAYQQLLQLSEKELARYSQLVR